MAPQTGLVSPIDPAPVELGRFADLTLDYARTIEGSQATVHDLRTSANRDQFMDSETLDEALATLTQSGAGNRAHQLIEIEFTTQARKEVHSLDIYFLLRLITSGLDHSIQLYTKNENTETFRIPSLNFLAAAMPLLLPEHNTKPVTWVPTAGYVERDVLHQHHRKNEHAIGLSTEPLRLIDDHFDGIVHGFEFAIHDLAHGVLFYALHPFQREFACNTFDLLGQLPPSLREQGGIEEMRDHLVDLLPEKPQQRVLFSYIWNPMTLNTEGNSATIRAINKFLLQGLQELTPALIMGPLHNFVSQWEKQHLSLNA